MSSGATCLRPPAGPVGGGALQMPSCDGCLGDSSRQEHDPRRSDATEQRRLLLQMAVWTQRESSLLQKLEACPCPPCSLPQPASSGPSCHELLSTRSIGPLSIQSSSVPQSCPTPRPQGLQQARLPWPSLSPGACSNSRPLSQWRHPAISSSVVPFSCPQSFPASGSFLVSQLCASGGQSIGASVSGSVLPLNIQGWLALSWRCYHFLPPRVFLLRYRAVGFWHGGLVEAVGRPCPVNGAGLSFKKGRHFLASDVQGKCGLEDRNLELHRGLGLGSQESEHTSLQGTRGQWSCHMYASLELAREAQEQAPNSGHFIQLCIILFLLLG